MKKIKYLILVFCLMIIPFVNINATEEPIEPINVVEDTELNVEQIKKFNVVGADNLNESYNVEGSSIVAGNNVTVENTVKGIDMVFGNNISYNGNSDYSLIAGNVINVTGVTKNDGFIFGNAITFDKEYVASRDLFVFGSTVVLKGEITRDVTIYSSSVVLEDLKVSGNVTIYATSIDVKNAEVEGKLSYNEDAEINIDASASISEKETYKEEAIETNTNIVLNNIIDYASVLVIFAALALILPNMFNKIENKLEDMSISKFISMLGYGILFLILIPIVFVLLLTVTIGIPLGLLLLTIYMIVLCLSTVFTGYFVGLMVWKKFIKKDVNILLVGLIGISIIKVLMLIPYIGAIVAILNILLSLSIFIKLFTKDA